jgi:peptide chain release factor 1
MARPVASAAPTTMFEHLDDLMAELTQLEAESGAVYASGDRRAMARLGRREKELRPVVEAYSAYRSAERQLAEAKDLLKGETDPEMRAFLDSEAGEHAERLERLEAELKELLLPRDPNDGRNVIMEIQGAEGGEEANLWAGDLFRMYQRFAERHGLGLELLSGQPSDHGGYRDVTFMVRGDTAWARLKYEGGPHRVQRVPETESQGRIHTSAATVAVLPEAEDVDVEVHASDLEIQVYRSSGPGGQSVNTTDSAVRITHKPSGLVVACQDERSQLQNRDRAMQILRARLLKLQQETQDAAVAEARRGQVKGGGRSEKIRTYNFKENRVTDHRIGMTLYSLDRVLDGELDELIGGLAADERARQLGAG